MNEELHYIILIFRNINAYTDFLTLVMKYKILFHPCHKICVGLISLDMAVFYTTGKCLTENLNPYLVCCCLWVAR